MKTCWKVVPSGGKFLVANLSGRRLSRESSDMTEFLNIFILKLGNILIGLSDKKLFFPDHIVLGLLNKADVLNTTQISKLFNPTQN